MLGVDIRGALNLVGWLFQYLSPAFLAPAAIAVLYAEAVWPFLVAGAVTFACGAGVEASARARATSLSRWCGC
jgi:hypothetical protein